MPGCARVELPKRFDLLQRQIVTAEVQPAVKEHRAVTGREDETVAIQPTRIRRIVHKHPALERRADFRGPQRQAEVAR